MPRKKTALRFAAPVAVLALALTACGGGDDKKSEDKKADAPKADSAGSAPKQPSALKPGESTTGKTKEGDAMVTYDIAAQKVDLGTEAETKKLVSDPKKAKGLVAAVAHVKYTHKAGAPLTDVPDVGDGAEIYADGTRGGLLIGASEDAAGCEDELELEGWKKGESHELCQTYLVPANAKELEVHWTPEDSEDEPVIWKFAAK
ncbi:Lipoprotein OS=Streptomyces alboniger OX=132473 GN=CP975_13390 PE=4 SV=1 [Streptomyces alboniger]